MAGSEQTADLAAANHFIEHAEALGRLRHIHHSAFRVHGGKFLKDIELYQSQGSCLRVRDVYLHTLQILALAGAVERLDVYGTEHHAGYLQRVQPPVELGGVNPVGGNEFEGQCITHAYADIVQLAEYAYGRIVERRGGVGLMGRRKHPGHTRVLEGHRPFVTLHGNDGQLDLLSAGHQPLLIKIGGKLAGRKSI